MEVRTSPLTLSCVRNAILFQSSKFGRRTGRTRLAARPEGCQITKVDGTRAAFSARGLLRAAIAMTLLLAFGFAQTGSAQTPTPLSLSNNYFVTGDYVVGGVGLRGLGDATGFATGKINIPDPQAYATGVPPQRVPAGADIVAAFLYWATVETSGTFAGQKGFFGPDGGTNYPITGTILGNPNAPTSWSSGGCSGSSQGSKTIVSYRADVRPYLPLDVNGIIQPNTSYDVRLADGGKSGNAPFTLGATLVIIYRVMSTSAHMPLNAVVIYDGSYSPSNTSQTVTQQLQGFYQAGFDQYAGPLPMAKITHIVGNGQSNKFEQVNVINDKTGIVTPLPSLYGTLPPFPGNYNGSWDNPTWILDNLLGNPLKAGDSSETTSVVPSSTNKGCVSWGATILSTTIQDSDLDGLLDVWKTNQGYCDAAANRGTTNQGSCPLGSKDPSWVALPGAQRGQKDLFAQLDYMCSKVIISGANTTCDPSGTSFLPSAQALANVTGAFTANGHSINVHIITDNNNVILEQSCSDTVDANGNPVYCPFPGQAGAVGWKSGYEFLKTQPLNYPDETSCETRTPPGQPAGSGPLCLRRFPLGQRNSYHEIISANALGVPNWSFQGGSLTNVTVLGKTVTFTTSSPHGLVVNPNAPNGRVTIYGAGSTPILNGTSLVQSVPTPTSFTITTASAITAPTKSTDPYLAVASGQVGTGSGFSDLGGADSLITLGLWGADGQTVPVQSGTIMHEVGHSLGLTHGGSYPVQGSYAFTFEANCKPNYQSVMNYMFQVDLLTDRASLTDSDLDYSEEELPALDENALLPGALAGAILHPATKWYAPNQPIGSPATRHCDGTPILQTDQPMVQPMFRLDGPTSSIPWPTPSSPQDINFDGKIETNQTMTGLRGYADWPNIDLRQTGATGNDFWAGGAPFGGGGAPFGGGGAPFGGGGAPFGGGGAPYGSGGAPFGSGGAPFGSGGAPFGGGGVGEITTQTAYSVVRVPTKLATSLTQSNYVNLIWMAPSFGQSQISAFNIYRSVNGGPFTQYATVVIPAGTPLPLGPQFTSYTDQKVACATYTYFVTTILTDGRGSVPSISSPPISVPCTFVGFLSPLVTAGTVSAPTFSGPRNLGNAVPIKWEILDANGNPIGDLSTLKLLQACPTTGRLVPPAISTVPPCVLIYSPTIGAEGSTTFRFSSPQFIVNWDTGSLSGLAPGFWTIELQLNDGSAVKATTIQF